MRPDNKLKALLDLGRVANLPTICTNVLAAWWLSSANWTNLAVMDRDLLYLLLGACLMYTGGTTLNDACDHDFDLEKRPERPLPMGIFTLRGVWLLGAGQLLIGAVLLIFVAGASWLVVLGLVAAIVTYDLVHKEWAGSVVLMGLCRGLLYLVPATVPGHHILPVILFQAAGLMIYVIGVSLTARSESLPDGRHAWWTIFLLLAPLVPWVVQLRSVTNARWLATGIMALFMVMVFFAVRRMRESPPLTIGPGVAQLLAGICIVDALIMSPLRPDLALLLVGGYVVTRVLQRYFAST